MKNITIETIKTLYADEKPFEQSITFKLEGTKIKGEYITKTSKELSEEEIIKLIKEEIYGVDLSNKESITATISFDNEKFHKDLIERITEELESQRKNIGNYIQCKHE